MHWKKCQEQQKQNTFEGEMEISPSGCGPCLVLLMCINLSMICMAHSLARNFKNKEPS